MHLEEKGRVLHSLVSPTRHRHALQNSGEPRPLAYLRMYSQVGAKGKCPSRSNEVTAVTGDNVTLTPPLPLSLGIVTGRHTHGSPEQGVI